MNASSKNKKTLIPISLDIFKKYASDKTYENDINRTLKNFNKFVVSEEKHYEILNNAFTQYNSNALNDNQSKIRNRGFSKRMSFNFKYYKLINQDINDKNIDINNVMRKIKIKNNNLLNIKNSSKNNKIDNIYSYTFNNTISNIFPKMKENKTKIIIPKNKINLLSSKKLDLNISKNFINGNDINTNNIKLTDKNKIITNYALNKTDGLFNSFKNSKKILNFRDFYNLNTNSEKELKKESNISNIFSKSYKTMNNINQNNMNQNKLYYDIKQIKDINSQFVDKMEKSEIKLNQKSKKFRLKYKKSKNKFFGNEDIKLIKSNRKKNKKKIDYNKYSHKALLQKKIIANNYKKKKNVSEEIKLRKAKEKNFYELIDNIIMNNNLFVYDINKIDKRLRLKKEFELD